MQRKRGGRIFLILGVLLAVIAFFLVFVTLKGRTTATEAETKTVYVATRDIPERVTVREADLATKEIPLDLVPIDAIKTKEEALGQIAGSPILMGEIIRATRFAKTNGESGAAFAFDKGQVAVALNVNDVSGVANLLKSGDFVDVLLSLDISSYDLKGNESKERHVALLTLQNVKVLSVGSGTIVPEEKSADGSGARITEWPITVLLNRQDALLLKYAREKGAVDLALRSSQDHEITTTDPVYLEEIVDRYKLEMPPVIVKEGQQPGEMPSQPAGEGQGGEKS